MDEENNNELNLEKCTALGERTKDFLQKLQTTPNAGPAKIEQYCPNPKLPGFEKAGYLNQNYPEQLLENPLVKKEFSEILLNNDKHPLKSHPLNTKELCETIKTSFIFGQGGASKKERNNYTKEVCKELFEERYEDIIYTKVTNSLWTEILIIADLKKNIITIIGYTLPN
ncbi:MAG: hypothetical protein NTY48_06505 [Candidatus Diapherotrites archaeon]|nr:hypothetical protein [Candidatus Diapherotrites archaeon]